MKSSDLVIAGSGPAGVLLALACAERGVKVSCVSPSVDENWERCFGMWSGELPDYLKGCVETSWIAPMVYTWSSGERMLDKRYLKLDTIKLQRLLMERCREAGVEFVCAEVSTVEHRESDSVVAVDGHDPLSCRYFVDATGGKRNLVESSAERPIAFQTAYGEHLEVEHHPFKIGEMVFMDLRSVGPTSAGASPSFLYAMPLSKTEIFVEETSLISATDMSMRELQNRLHERLKQWNIKPKKRLGIERCRIPMTFPMPDRKQRTLAFGASASMVHPATGYLLARTIKKAPGVAKVIAEELKSESLTSGSQKIWKEIWPVDDVRKWELYTFGANFLAKLDDDQLERFFDTFFDLPTEDWYRFMTGELSAANLAGMMSRVFLATDSNLRWALIKESVGANSAPLIRAAVSH
jgi:lycopene cyclase-like protein